MICYLTIKSDTTHVKKNEFDLWYETEHLNEAMKALMAKSAKRGWIKDTNFHIAIYEFTNVESAEKALKSKNLQKLIKIFDDKWNNKVPRTRELTKFVQMI